MNTIDDLKKHIEEIENILLLALMYFKDTRYLANPKEPMEKVIISKYRVFQRIKYSFWVLTVLELCKLFINRDNDKFNLHKFMNVLLYNYVNLKWKHAMDKKIIHGFIQKLNGDLKPIIGKVETLRDKLYAHTDPTDDVMKIVNTLNVNYSEIDELLNFAKEIVFTIKSKYFDVHTDFDIEGMDRFNYVLVNLNRFDEYFNKEINEKMKN